MSGRSFIDVRLFVHVDKHKAEFNGVPNPAPNEIIDNIVNAAAFGFESFATVETFRIMGFGIESEHGVFEATKPTKERYQGNG